MHKLNKQIQEQVHNNRERLLEFEKILIRSGYQRDGLFRPNHRGGVHLSWRDGHLVLRRRKMGIAEMEDVAVQNMTERDIIVVVENLGGLIDHLEQNSRFLLEDLRRALITLKRITEKVKTEPQPL